MIHAVNGQAPDLREQIESIIIDYHNDLGGEDTVKPEVVSKPVEIIEPIEEERKLELVPAVPQITVNPEDLVLEVRNGKVWTTSLEISRIYGKEHYNVLRDIENLDQSPEFIALNFEGCTYQGANGKSLPMFYISKDGAYALCFKFQGKLAAQFREAFIKKFNEMEEELRNPKPLALSGDFGALLIQAGQQIQEQNLVITTLKQQAELLAEDVVKQVEVNTKLATENITLNALTSADEKTYSLTEGGKLMLMQATY